MSGTIIVPGNPIGCQAQTGWRSVKNINTAFTGIIESCPDYYVIITIAIEIPHRRSGRSKI
jgi:hypothetical protein